MPQDRTYSIGISRLKRSFLFGFELFDDGSIKTVGEGLHFLIFPCFRGEQKGEVWGRFHARVTGERNSSLKIYAFSKDEEEGARIPEDLEQYFKDETIPAEEKKELFIRADGVKAENAKDVLLTELRGQYLWIALELEGSEEAVLSEMFLHCPGDNFMQTFPEVFQEENGFFQRYLSVFSSLYADMQRKIDQMGNYLDAETAPKEMLPVLAGWLGIQVENGFPEEKILRRLLKEAYQLNRMKGTRGVLDRLAKIVFEDDVMIIEKNLLEASTLEEKNLYQKLYGKSRWDVTILVNCAPEKRQIEQFLFLASQFKPARCQIHLEFRQKCNSLDSYSFLDQNAKLLQHSYVTLGQSEVLDGSGILK